MAGDKSPAEALCAFSSVLLELRVALTYAICKFFSFSFFFTLKQLVTGYSFSSRQVEQGSVGSHAFSVSLVHTEPPAVH